MKNVIFGLLAMVLFGGKAAAQPNCDYFKYLGDTLRYEACLAAEKRAGHYQFSKAYQLALDSAIQIDSTWAFAYSAKSTAYLKAGDFLGWKPLIDKAVQYDTLTHLPARAWCRFKFFADYEGAIADFLLLKQLSPEPWGHTGDGYYLLDVAFALCYKEMGQTAQAIQLMEKCIEDTTRPVGLFDQLHLGVMYMEQGEYERAIQQFEVQEVLNDMAENRFFSALAYKYLRNEEQYAQQLSVAKQHYLAEQRMFDPYTEQVDQVFWADLLAEEQLGYSERVPPVTGFLLREYRKR